MSIVCLHTQQKERKCSDPCWLDLQVILECNGIRRYVTAQMSAVIQINSILFTYANCIDRNMTHAAVFHGDVNKSTEAPAAIQLQ